MREKKPLDKKDLENYAKSAAPEDESAVEVEVVEAQDQPADAPAAPESLEFELAAQKDKYLRLVAEYDNYRKRSFKEAGTARFAAQLDAVSPFLTVFDHFDMAVAAAEKAENMEAIRQGLRMILTEFQKAIDEIGIAKIDAVGQDFNPNLHEAVGQEASDDIPAGRVLKQWRCGYRLGERVIRPANVVVSAGTATEADGQ